MPTISVNWQSLAVHALIGVLWVFSVLALIPVLALVPKRRTVIRHALAWLTVAMHAAVGCVYFYLNWSAVWAAKSSAKTWPPSLGLFVLFVFAHGWVARDMLRGDKTDKPS